MRTLLVSLLCGLVGCADPGPEVGREIGVDSGSEGLELVSAFDVAQAPVGFRDLSCYPGPVQGYRLAFRVVVGTPGTTVRLRINTDDSIDYRADRVDIASGALSPISQSPDDALLLHGGVLGQGAEVDGVVDIPVVEPSDAGLVVFWTASVSDPASFTTGSGRWSVHNTVDILQLLATTGPTEQGTFVDGSVALYRLLK